MARNEEKHFGKLNRIILAKLKEDHSKKNPKRPRLEALHTVEDITKWLPSITKELEFCLAQSQVSCYPARIIEEFHEKINSLKSQYQAFVRKLKTLDTSCTVTPWTERAYGKRKHQAAVDGPSMSKKKRQYKSELSPKKNTAISNLNRQDCPDTESLQCDKLVLDKSDLGQCDFTCERFSLPLLESQTEQLYKEDTERGNLVVAWNCEEEAETHSGQKTGDPQLFQHEKVLRHLRETRFARAGDGAGDSSSETEENNTSASNSCDHTIFSVESEYGFHNDNPLDFRKKQKNDERDRLCVSTVFCDSGDSTNTNQNACSGSKNNGSSMVPLISINQTQFSHNQSANRTDCLPQIASEHNSISEHTLNLTSIVGYSSSDED